MTLSLFGMLIRGIFLPIFPLTSWDLILWSILIISFIISIFFLGGDLSHVFNPSERKIVLNYASKLLTNEVGVSINLGLAPFTSNIDFRIDTDEIRRKSVRITMKARRQEQIVNIAHSFGKYNSFNLQTLNWFIPEGDNFEKIYAELVNYLKARIHRLITDSETSKLTKKDQSRDFKDPTIIPPGLTKSHIYHPEVVNLLKSQYINKKPAIQQIGSYSCFSCRNTISFTGQDCPICGNLAPKCVICLIDPEDGDTVVQFSCCQAYSHKNHAEGWFVRNSKCPYCSRDNPMMLNVQEIDKRK